MRDMNNARDTHLFHSSRILFVDEDGNFSEVSTPEEYNGYNEPYLVTTSASTARILIESFGNPSTNLDSFPHNL